MGENGKSQPLAFPPPPPAYCFAVGLGVFARLLIADSGAFARLLQSHPAQSGTPPLQGLLGLWLDSFDSLPNLAARKLSALALCALLHLPLANLPEHLISIITCLTAVWFEVSC